MCFGYFDEFPEYIIPHREIYCKPNCSLIHFSVYTCQGTCATRVIIPNGTSLCRIYEENIGMNNGLIKRPTYGKKKQLRNIPCSIG